MSWREYKLEDICKITIGKTPSRKNPKFWDKEKRGDNVWVSISDLSKITNKLIGESKEYISDEGAQLFKPVKKGTLLMSFKLSIGKLAFAEKDIYTNEAIAAFNIYNDSILSSEFLFYYFTFFDWDLETENDQKLLGRTLNKKKLSQITIAIPPLPVQKQIVEKLDAAFADIDKAISATEKNIENAEALFSRILIQSFEAKIEGSIHKTLRDVSIDFSRGKSKHRPRNDPDLFGGHYPFIQTGNVANSSKFINHYDKSYNETGLKQSKLWSKNTVCITIAANIADCGILSFDACFPDSIIGITVDPEQTSSEYVFYLLSYFKDFIQSKSKGAAQQNINLGTFENEKFPFPSSLAAQSELIAELNNLRNQVNRLKSIYSEKLKQLNSLKSSILNQASSGELKKDAA